MGAAQHVLEISLDQESEFRLVAPQNPVPLSDGQVETATVFVIGDRSSLVDGARDVSFRVRDGDELDELFPYVLLGPKK